MFCRDIQLTWTFTSLYKKIPFKGEWSLAKSCLKQNYCHACYKRFAVFFPLPSGCVIKFTKSECLRNSSLSLTLTFSLSSAVTSRQVLVSAFIEKLFSSCLASELFYKSFFAFPNRTVIRESMKCWFGFINNRTYTQIHTPTVVQGEGVDGTPPESFWYVAVFRNDFAFSGKLLIFSTRWSIIFY